jgi:Zn-dependent protease
MRGWRLGRIAGIDIEIHFTWLIIFILVVMRMSYLPSNALTGLVAWPLRLAAALFATALFFASLLLHELAHSIVARRNGLPVHRITLFLFGGVSQLEEEPRSAASEFVMAIVGPLTSLLLGFALTRGSGFIPRSSAFLSIVAESVAFVGWLNFLLAIFNMVPAFPLDGGRVLRSIVWAITRDLRRSTHVATALGKIFGYGMAGYGVAVIFVFHDPWGIWMIFLGWMVANAAEQSYRRVLVTSLLHGLHVADVMSSPAITVPGDMNLEQFAHTYEFMLSHGAYPVVAEGKVAGMLHRDVLRTTPRHLWPMTQVRQVMEPLDMDTMLIDAAAPLDLAFTRIMETGRPRLMVMGERSQLAGILSQADVMRALQSQKR